MPDPASRYLAQAQSFKEAGDYKSARNSLESAISLDPDLFEARVNLADACIVLGDDDNAIRHLLFALNLRPDFSAGHNSLGTLLRKAGDLKRGIAHFRLAISVKPDFYEAYYNLGNCLRDIEQFDEAVACFKMACNRKPLFAEAWSNLGEALQITGRINDALACFKTVVDAAPSCAPAFSNYLLTLNYVPGYDPQQLFKQHLRFGAAFEQPKPAEPDDLGAQGAQSARTGGRKLCIGYVSADFRNHPVSRFIEPVFTNHNMDDFKIVSFSGAAAPDEKTGLFKQASDGWVDTDAMTDSALAGRIREEKIDILVDLSGHSADNRLPVFAQKPAPVQVTWLGYPNTTGLSGMDCRITDGICDPAGEAISHTEKLVRISPCFCCYRPPEAAPPAGPVPCRKTGGVTFGSTHMLGRLNDELLDLWSRLLLEIPSSRILIVRTTLKGSGLDRVHKRFEANSVPENRVIFQNVLPEQGHLGVYRDMDVFLDSFPWSGHTTVCEALWMGVPAITLAGNRHAGRMVASVLSCLDMKDFVAGTKEEYLSVAAGLASDVDKLETLRGTLRERMKNSPLCDGKAFTVKLEAAYRRMWRERCGEPG